MIRQPIDLSLLFARRDSRPPIEELPGRGLAASAADRIAMPLDLRSATTRAALARLT